jgi:hypothetical protein
MSNIVEVVPQETYQTYEVSSFGMNIIILEINVKALVAVTTYDKIGRQLYEKQFIIEGEEYSQWGVDDTYLKNLVAEKLNLIVKNK